MSATPSRLADLDLVFIMGHHRSGTTILYKVLAETGLFNITTAFHILLHERLPEIHRTGSEARARAELSDLFERKGLKDREFDSMKITPDIPEEYAWIFNPQGRRPRLTPRTLPAFARFCDIVTRMQQPGRPLLLKNPFDTRNFAYIRQVLPQARFVYIHRDPVEVVNSQVRALRSIFDRKNEYVALVMQRYRALYRNPLKLWAARFIYSRRLPFLVNKVIWNVTGTNRYYMRHAEVFGSTCTDLTYPELCAAPNETIRRVLGFLKLQEERPRDYASLIQPRESPLVPEVRSRAGRIRRENAAYCEKFGV